MIMVRALQIMHATLLRGNEELALLSLKVEYAYKVQVIEESWKRHNIKTEIRRHLPSLEVPADCVCIKVVKR